MICFYWFSNDFGRILQHPYTVPEKRERTVLTRPLRTAAYYATKGGVLHVAERVANESEVLPRAGWPKGVFRTHHADPDPIVATFDKFASAETAAAVIAVALPQVGISAHFPSFFLP